MHTTWLNVAETKKIDAFQARCLRKLTGIPHSYLSRTTNETVRQTAGAARLSLTLRRNQLLYLGDLARMPTGNVLRDTVFQPNSFKIVKPCGPRRRGRPRNEWAGKLYSEAIIVADGESVLTNMWAPTPAAKSAWQKAVAEHCKT